MTGKRSRTEWLLDIYGRLFGLYGDCVCPLKHRNPYELLVAVVLSAQCRDDRVNMVTPELFRRWPTAEVLAEAVPAELEEVIHPVGLYHAKALNLIGAAKRISTAFNGSVPDTMEDLTSLPGVGRKTANVILGDAFGVPGFPVDTHVRRLLNLIGVFDSSDPVRLELMVNRALSEEYWTNFSHLLIRHGRLVCHARRPVCGQCVLSDICNHAGKRQKQ